MSIPRSSSGRATLVGAAAATILSALTGCRSASASLAEADREVYGLLAKRRAEFGESAPFTIAPPANSLRARLEQGEVLAPIDLVAALSIAAENSRDYRRRMEDLYLAALDLTLERFRFAVQRSGTFGALLQGNGDGDIDASADAGFGLRRVLGTGAEIVGNIGLSLTHVLVGTEGETLGSNLSLSITQPLLRGFGERIVKEPLTQAERNVTYEVREFERFRRTFAVDVTSRYFAVLRQVDSLENERVNMENLVLLRERNQQLGAAGRLSDIQVDQALQDELRSRNRLIQVEEQLQGLLDDFKLFLGLPLTARIELDPGELDDLAFDEESRIEEARALDCGMRLRLDLQTALDQVEDAERRVELAADDLRASLDVTATGGAQSDANNPLKYDRSDLTWTLGVDVDLPLDRLAERNAYRESYIDLDRARRNAEELADEIRANLRDSLREARASLETVKLQQRAVELAERRAASAELNQKAGRADTRDALEAQEALLQARNDLTAARIDYRLAELALWRDMELLRVDESGIRLEREPLDSARTQP